MNLHLTVLPEQKYWVCRDEVGSKWQVMHNQVMVKIMTNACLVNTAKAIQSKRSHSVLRKCQHVLCTTGTLQIGDFTDLFLSFHALITQYDSY